MKKYKIKMGLIYVLIFAIMSFIGAILIGIVYLVSLSSTKIGLVVGIGIVIIIVFIVGYISAY